MKIFLFFIISISLFQEGYTAHRESLEVQFTTGGKEITRLQPAAGPLIIVEDVVVN